MNYRVEWTEEAENDLAAFQIAAEDQSVVTRASEWLDRRLALDPRNFGEEWISVTHRIAARDPIGVEFEVIEDDKLVLVHGVFTLG
jgi:hypothetical protein